jgi:hypothetical protein
MEWNESEPDSETDETTARLAPGGPTLTDEWLNGYEFSFHLVGVP